MQQRFRLVACLGIELGLLIAIASLGDLRRQIPAFLVLFVLAAIAYVIAAQLFSQLRASLRALLLVAVVLRLPLFFTQPSLSDDVWRYIHDGRAQLAGFNPYRYAPTDPATAVFRGPEYQRINHPELRTIYPPVAQFAFRFTAAMPVPLLAWRLLLLVAELAILMAAAAILRANGGPQNNLALYAWHPLAIVETIGSAHMEALGIALLVMGLLLAGRGSQFKAGIAFAASAAAKLVAAPLAFIATRNYHLPLAFVVTVAALYAPFIGDGSNPLGSFAVFAERWESNGSVHTVLATLIGQPVSRLFAAALLIGALAVLRYKNVNLIDGAALYFLALFALAPVVHPWYLLWLLTMLALRRNPFDAFGIAALYWTVSVVLAYAAVYQQQLNGEWRVPTVLALLQYAPCYALLVLAYRFPTFSITNLIPSVKNNAANI